MSTDLEARRHDSPTGRAPEVKEFLQRFFALPSRRRVRVERMFELFSECEDEAEQDEIAEAIVEILSPDLLGISKPLGAPAKSVEEGVDQETAEAVTSYKSKIGQEVRKWRQAMSLTQTDLAQKAGIPQSHVSRIEKGVHLPTSKTIKRLAEALNVESNQLDFDLLPH